jgi:hypothetical protein
MYARRLLAGSLAQNLTYVLGKLNKLTSDGADAALTPVMAVAPGVGARGADGGAQDDAADDAYETHPYRDLMASLLLMLAITLVGTLGFLLLENAGDGRPACAALGDEARGVTLCDLWTSESPMTFMTAFYFTFCTVTTVGYGDIYPDSFYSKVRRRQKRRPPRCGVRCGPSSGPLIHRGAAPAGGCSASSTPGGCTSGSVALGAVSGQPGRRPDAALTPP